MGMRHFLRALRFAYPYRYRLGISFLCALLAAALWSLNFTAIYPILMVFGNGQNLQTWIDVTIEKCQKERVEPAKAKVDILQAKKVEIENRPDDKDRDRNLRQNQGELAAAEIELAAAQLQLHRFRVEKRYIDAYCPPGRFMTLVAVLMAVVVLGLILLLVRLKAWREDLVVVSLLGAGSLAFLILSPIGPDESRYLLVPAAVLLMACFAGWSDAKAWASPAGRWARVIPLCVGILTMGFVVLQFRSFARRPQNQIGNVVAFIMKDPARAAERIVVPPNLEGPVIAEFVAQSRHRPYDTLLRPGKILAHSDWFGGHYSPAFGTAEEMMEYFRKDPVHLIMWYDRPESTLRAHERTMSEMLRQYPLSWHKVPPLDSANGVASSWTIYEYDSPPRQSQ